MSERSRERGRERDDDRRATTGPFGTMLGVTFGPVGAAVGSVVDETRVAFTFSFGTGVRGSPGDDSDRGDDGLDDPATIEIEDVDETGAAGSATENELDDGSCGGDAGTDADDAA